MVLEGQKGMRCRINIFFFFLVIPRSEVWTLKKPKTISKKLKHGFRAPDLSGMLHMFKGEERQGRSVDLRCLWC